MGVSGIERQLFPFLSNSIAQGFGQIPLLIGSFVDATVSPISILYSRRRAQSAYNALSVFAPPGATAAAPDTTDVAALSVTPLSARGYARGFATRDPGVTAPPGVTAVAPSATNVSALVVIPATARGRSRGFPNWGPTTTAPIFSPILKGPTDVAALSVIPHTARGRDKRSHRAPNYFAPLFFTVVTGPANVADLMVAPTQVHRRKLINNRLTTTFSPTAPFVGGTPPGPVLSSLEPENGTVTFTLMYWTDIQRAQDGSERRASLLTKPREVLSQSIMMLDDAVGSLRSTLMGDPLAQTYLPLYFEAVPSKNLVNSNTVTVDSTYADWIYVGAKILLLNFNNQYFTANVVAISGSGANTILQLDATPPIAHDVYTIGSRVAPLVPVTPKDGQGLPRWLVNMGRWDATFDVASPETTYGTGAVVNTYDGMNVLDVRPRADYGSGEDVVSQDTFSSIVTTVDTKNTYENKTSLTHPRIIRQHMWFIHNPAERQFWKKFIDSVSGRQKVFLLPTWRDDLYIYAQPAPLDTVLQIKSSPDYVNNYFGSLAHRRLQLEHADGSVEYVKVTNATDAGAGVQYLTLSSGVSGVAITRISMLEQVRFDNSNDEFQFEWNQNMLGKIVLHFTTVNQ